MTSLPPLLFKRPARRLLAFLALGAIGALAPSGAAFAQQPWTCTRLGDASVAPGKGPTQDQAFRNVRSNCIRTYTPSNLVQANCVGTAFRCQQDAPPRWFVCQDSTGRWRQEGPSAETAKMGAVNACTAANGGGAAYGTCLNAVTCRPSNN
ncbi:hypothetical protein [Phreatobacter cathodiphilus]|uniref:Uncharacterized protein n=1 Tax=Phreatobacter cathodiphilus TaxID=1868589 RepID=A0A2S0NBK5_9HYPH|nr:hypothetical protein [Phreatobacter cathodiphilus]AVO45549.1 hypothetical protein C6569_11000 [Phreatobacter cathodiphilus]